MIDNELSVARTRNLRTNRILATTAASQFESVGPETTKEFENRPLEPTKHFGRIFHNLGPVAKSQVSELNRTHSKQPG